MSIKKLGEDWSDYKNVVKSNFNNRNKIKDFKSTIEQIIIPELKKINIDVDLSSANTLSNGEVSYEAIADGTLITISFQANNKYAESPNNVVAELYTMSGSEPVGELDLNDLDDTILKFLDAAEVLGLDLTDEEDREKAASDKKVEKDKPVTKTKPSDKPAEELPLPKEPEEKVDNSSSEPSGEPLLNVYSKAIEVYRKTGKLNNQMIVTVEEVSKGASLLMIHCYYIGKDKCLVSCDELGLDSVVDFKTFGKYLVDLFPKYKTSVIIVYDENMNEVYSGEVNNEIGGNE